MVKITFELEQNLNDKFRKNIAISKGFYRGAIQEALIEAIKLWMKFNKAKKEKSKKIDLKEKKPDIPFVDQLENT